MKKISYSIVLVTTFALLAACNSPSGSTSTGDMAPPDGSVMVRGSGQACPVLKGDYVCSDAIDMRKGRSKMTFKSTGRTVTIDRGTGVRDTYIADGEIHTVRAGRRSLQYVVDCQPSQISLHAATDDFNTVSTITFDGMSRFSIRTTGTVRGTPEDEQRRCTRRIRGRLN